MLAGEEIGQVHIPAYREFISEALIGHLQGQLKPVEGVAGLLQVGASGGLENAQSLRFLLDLYDAVKGDLHRVLQQRVADRAFIDQRTRACYQFNQNLGIDFRQPEYHTIIGQQDADGRVVIGPLNEFFCRAGGGQPIAGIPDFLRGPHVTLFGPPDDAKLSINAMNAFHRALENEPAIVGQLLHGQECAAMWGADDEDSKTPLRADLIRAGENLTACLNGEIAYTDPRSGRSYALAADHRSIPIKRFPGLALPCAFLFQDGNPLPLHVYDFALHFFANWKNAKALAFYLPKLENEEEAAYIRVMLQHAERLLRLRHPEYVEGSIRLMVVLENPRAVFRVNEIMDALHPYFVGASLGWHDYLASTARLMKEDGNYRIPVKADPNIVIKHIKASHDLLAQVVGSRGGIKVGGMYGVLPSDNTLHSESFQVAIKGFIKDVITQMKRDLTGFWVAHPDFVRLGLALVQGWKHLRNGDAAPLEELVKALVVPAHHREMLAFLHGPDVQGLDIRDAMYPRSLLVADEKESHFIANNNPEEIRYNIFQSLQYLADWLCGNGCVALPATIHGVAVRVMDDLATAERSRWEVWHELHHGRFDIEQFIRIAHEEMRFIQKDLSTSSKIVQVKWNERTRKWYPVAMHLMLHLMSSQQPVEFASQLLLPFTLDSIREQPDPLRAAMAIEPCKYELPVRVARCHAAFSACGSEVFMRAMASLPVLDAQVAQRVIMNLDEGEVNQAAEFHGDIGESAQSLDATAAGEQSGVSLEADHVRSQLRELGRQYRAKCGFKFLIAATGKSGEQMLQALRDRLHNPAQQELQHAREALWQIATHRLMAHADFQLVQQMQAVFAQHGVKGSQICIWRAGDLAQTLVFGERAAGQPVTPETCFQMASLSKPVAACMAMEYFRAAGIALTTSVQSLLESCGSAFRLHTLAPAHEAWSTQVTLAHLMNHQGLNMHYVHGLPADEKMPMLTELLSGNAHYDYAPVGVLHKPGTQFAYSGGGFMVLQHLIECREGKPIHEVARPFLQALGMQQFFFQQSNDLPADIASGYVDSGEPLHGARKFFPAFAAGAVAPVHEMARFLQALSTAYRHIKGCGPISHDTAVQMLHGVDKGSQAFMGCEMGLGIFTLQAAANRLCVHQGANDGFRSLFMHCYQGPDSGSGLVIACNGQQNAVAAITQVAQILLRSLALRGVDFGAMQARGSLDNVPQEQKVNTGYREGIFAAFQRDIPEAIVRRGARDTLADFNRVIGARIEQVSNQRFARGENIISPDQPLFDPALFGRQGKIMDSWESARHNPDACDWLILSLRAAVKIDCLSVSTQFHLGNQAQSIALQGWSEAHKQWQPLMEQSHLQGHSSHAFECLAKEQAFQKIRVQIFPDGGVSRLALYEHDLPAQARAHLFWQSPQRFPAFDAQTRKPLTPAFITDAEQIQRRVALQSPQALDLASAAFGAKVVSASNQHYGPATQVISPYPPLHMFDGLESARSREPNHSEDVVIQLAHPSRIGRIELDFTHFIYNNPREVEVEGRCDRSWISLVKRRSVKAYAGNSIALQAHAISICDQIRVTVFPDGGINRVRVFPYSASDPSDEAPRQRTSVHSPDQVFHAG